MIDHRYFYFCWGIGLGAAAGFLWAPMSGARARLLLSRKAQRTQNLMRQQASEIYDDVAGKIQHGKHALQRTGEGVADAFKAGKQVLTR
jgi:gas vesicle protein